MPSGAADPAKSKSAPAADDPDSDPLFEDSALEEDEESQSAESGPKTLLDASEEELRAELAKRAAAKKPPAKKTALDEMDDESADEPTDVDASW